MLRCQAIGLRAFHVQGREDLHSEWFDGAASVGLTAGMSTLYETVDAVEAELQRIAARAGGEGYGSGTWRGGALLFQALLLD